MTGNKSDARSPWHLWVIGIIALLWNGMGAVDYLMTRLNTETYLSQFTPAEREFFTTLPLWVVSTWAISVWSAVLASVALLLKSRWAETLFAIALGSFIATAFQNYMLADPNMAEVTGGFATAFSVVIFVATFFFWMYAWGMKRRGVLG